MPTLGLYFYEPTSISSKVRREEPSITGTCLGAFRFLASLLFHTSCLGLRCQPRGFIKRPLKPPHPGGPLVHPHP